MKVLPTSRRCRSAGRAQLLADRGRTLAHAAVVATGAAHPHPRAAASPRTGTPRPAAHPGTRPHTRRLTGAARPFRAGPAASRERLGSLVVREGLITREHRDKGLQEQRQSGTRVGYNLVKLGCIQETELTKMLARQFKMPAVDLSRFEVDPRIAKLIPADLAIKHLVLPLKRDGRTLTVAIADPTNLGVLGDLKFLPRYEIFPGNGGRYRVRGATAKA